MWNCCEPWVTLLGTTRVRTHGNQHKWMVWKLSSDWRINPIFYVSAVESVSVCSELVLFRVSGVLLEIQSPLWKVDSLFRKLVQGFQYFPLHSRARERNVETDLYERGFELQLLDVGLILCTTDCEWQKTDRRLVCSWVLHLWLEPCSTWNIPIHVENEQHFWNKIMVLE